MKLIYEKEYEEKGERKIATRRYTLIRGTYSKSVKNRIQSCHKMIREHIG